jgi:hypothetical protein
MRVRFRGVAQVRDRIARERVRAALKQDQLRGGSVDIPLDFLPRLEKRVVARARRHRNIELRALGRAAAGLAAATGTGIEKTAVLVQIGKREVGIALERVEHAVAVMRIDVYVRDSANVVPPSRGLDRHAAVVEHAEPCRLIACGVMQAADRNERARNRPRDDGLERRERAAHYVRGGLVDAGECGRVARVKQTAAARRQLGHAIDVRGDVKILELRARR